MPFMETHAPGGGAPLADALPMGHRIGPWVLDERIGTGGMGEVYRAHRGDGVYDHTVALKRVRIPGEAGAQRFAAERQRLATLDHPGIARIVDGGTDADDVPYMAVEYVEGAPIDRYVARHALGRKAIVGLVIDTCEAVGHAHSRLILHRDIKPGNVLVTDEGRVRLIDFGIASQVDEEVSQAALTPATAAPEQFGSGQATVQTDVFALGALLVTLLTGERPVRGEDGSFVLDEGGLGDADLAAIARRATAADPEDRYGSTASLAADLRAWCEGLPVAARGTDRLYLARTFLKRFRVPVAFAGAAVVALAVGLGVALWQRSEAIQARDFAMLEEQRGDAVRESLYTILAEGADASGTDNPREVLTAATRRMLRQFEEDPEKVAPTLQALGELQYHLGDYQSAIRVFDTMLKDVGRLDAETASIAYFNRARALQRSGGGERAAADLETAMAFWRNDPERHSLRLLDGGLLEAQLVRETDPERGLALLQRNLADTEVLNGAQSHRAGVVHTSIGMSLMNLGRMDEAKQSFARSDAVFRGLGAGASYDTLNVANNLATINTLEGNLEEAQRQFAEAVSIRMELFGPSGATAALLNNYGKTLLRLGRNEEAYRQLEQAQRMAERFTGAESLLHVAALSGLAEAELALGRADAIGKARRAAALARNTEPAAQAVATAQLALAACEAEGGSAAAARNALASARAAIEELGPAGARLIERADTIEASL